MFLVTSKHWVEKFFHWLKILFLIENSHIEKKIKKIVFFNTRKNKRKIWIRTNKNSYFEKRHYHHTNTTCDNSIRNISDPKIALIFSTYRIESWIMNDHYTFFGFFTFALTWCGWPIVTVCFAKPDHEIPRQMLLQASRTASYMNRRICWEKKSPTWKIRKTPSVEIESFWANLTLQGGKTIIYFGEVESKFSSFS